ncbi:crossover junction endodeoxyribonuclease RuvC [Magnetococcus sp. PR-3]|uniref:crossover junction endodeoxyribonuclease RuvC n=1 Tax=Magnetococcus sp. PR-3 TaxID=3120355 RepID=UPI002FCE4C98
MGILALDLGTKLGWAISHNGSVGNVDSGSVAFKKLDRFEGGGITFVRFRQWLTELKDQYRDLDMVVVEQVRNHKGVDASHKYGGLLATVTAWCEHHQIPYTSVGVGQIKKHWTGKGNAGKEEMIAEAKGRGFSPGDDNEADALALLDYVTNGPGINLEAI